MNQKPDVDADLFVADVVDQDGAAVFVRRIAEPIERARGRAPSRRALRRQREHDAKHDESD